MGDAPLSGRAWRNGGSRALRIGALLAVMPAMLIGQAGGDSEEPFHFDPPDEYQLTEEAKNRQTDYYAIGDLALYYWTDLWSSVLCEVGDEPIYPGVFFMALFSNAVGDFNDDGHQDQVISWRTWPSGAPDKPLSPLTFLLNDGNGNLVPAPDSLFADGAALRRAQFTEIRVADFNGDGAEDLVIGTFGNGVLDCETGVPTEHPEPIVLILSDGNGGLVDASHQIEGQEDGSPPEGFVWAHDLAIGDLDGDGDQDFYGGRRRCCMIQLRREWGRFSNFSFRTPQRRISAYPARPSG